MIVAIISQEKAEELQGIEYVPGVQFNPIQTEDSKWFISLVEAQYLTIEDIVEFIDYEPIFEEEIIEENE